MSFKEIKDKLEIGLQPDAPYRSGNLPERQQADPDCVEASTPGTDEATELARDRCDAGLHLRIVKKVQACR